MRSSALVGRLREERLLLVLLVALAPLLALTRPSAGLLVNLVDWRTIAALLGLMLLSRGLEESGYLALAGARLLRHVPTERGLAAALVVFSAILAAVVTNDVALFIVVPLTLSLRQTAQLPVGRLVIFEALAVNAGSSASPVGNPQNLFLWSASGVDFVEFLMAMLPLGVALTAVLLLLVPAAFPARAIAETEENSPLPTDRRLFTVSLGLYPVFLILVDRGMAGIAAGVLAAAFLLAYRRVFTGIDWLLLLVFVLMFVDLGLLAELPIVRDAAESTLLLPGGVFTAGVLVSQVISNVPAAIFLETFSPDWAWLAWGVSVGGFGLAIGSLANLIALRLARQKGMLPEFHFWSILMLGLAVAVAAGLRLAV